MASRKEKALGYLRSRQARYASGSAYTPGKHLSTRVGQYMIYNRGPLPFSNMSVGDIVGGYVSPRMTVGQMSFENRHFRQKPVVGLMNLDPRKVRKNYSKNKMLGSSTMQPVLRRKGGWSYQRIATPKRLYAGKPVHTKKTTSGSKKSATNRKHKRRMKKNKRPTVQSQIQDIRKKLNVDLAKHTYKSVSNAQTIAAAGRCQHHIHNGSTTSNIETSLANLRYFNPSVPGTLTTADGSTGTYSRDIHIKNFYQKLVVRNNFLAPAKVKVYLCKVKNDTSTGVKTAYENAITDQVINAGADSTDQLIYLSDIERLKETWNIDCVADQYLHNGEELETTHSTGSFNYDASHVDSEALTYQKLHKAFVWVVRVEGPMGHDTVADQQSLISAGVDTMLYTKVDIEYDAGVSLNDIYINETRAQAFTNSGRTGLKYATDNVDIDRT